MSVFSEFKKDWLIEKGVWYNEEDNNFYQTYHGRTRLLKKYLIKSKHKYGRNTEYYCFQIADADNARYQVLKPVSNVMYVWFVNDIPLGYDIDHINDDSTDDRIDNLQCITHAANIKKRGKGWNQ